MDSWKQYVFSVIVCAFLCAVVLQLVSDSNKKKLMQLICGIVLTISVLRPLTKLNPEALLRLPQWNPGGADSYIAEGELTASQAQEQYIKAACEAYILDKARQRNADVTVSIALDETRIPVFAEIEGESAPDIRLELKEILAEDLGIPKENQKWIWNQESSTS